MKALLKVLTTSLVLMMMGYSIQAQAVLTTIGTATYGGSEHYLIWDDNNNGNSVVWLDYRNNVTNWPNQIAWALGLGSAITSYNIDPGYTITWDDDNWRLPATVDEVGGSGFGKTNSEMGHLYHTELGKDINSGDFQQLVGSTYWYWSGTEYSSSSANAWQFRFNDGYTSTNHKNRGTAYGLAVRSGDVSAVPVPAAVWLFGSGLVGLIGVSRRKRRHLALR